MHDRIIVSYTVYSTYFLISYAQSSNKVLWITMWIPSVLTWVDKILWVTYTVHTIETWTCIHNLMLDLKKQPPNYFSYDIHCDILCSNLNIDWKKLVHKLISNTVHMAKPVCVVWAACTWWGGQHGPGLKHWAFYCSSWCRGCDESITCRKFGLLQAVIQTKVFEGSGESLH